MRLKLAVDSISVEEIDELDRAANGLILHCSNIDDEVCTISSLMAAIETEFISVNYAKAVEALENMKKVINISNEELIELSGSVKEYAKIIRDFEGGGS